MIATTIVALSITVLPAASAAEIPQYVLSTNSAASISVLATTGDLITGNILRGVPDGMGAYKNSNGTVTILSNHEISISDKTAQLSKSATGTWGSSISKLTYDPSKGEVTKLENFISSIQYYNYDLKQWSSDYTATRPSIFPAVDSYGGDTFSNGLNRFCSANLIPAGALLYKEGKKTFGFDGAVFLTGEEGGDYSRGFVFDMNGNGIQVPKFGLAGFENGLTNTKSGKTTVTMLNEDNGATNSQLYMYVGTKQERGANFAEKAGFTNGKLYTPAIKGIRSDNGFRTQYPKGKKADVVFNELNTDVNYVDYTAQAQALGMTFSRIEDGEWDPKNPNVYYFLTTESNKDAGATAVNPAEPQFSRDGGALWKMTFVDIKNPLKGATLELLLDGTESPYLSKPDNLAVDEAGYILIQEDPGNNGHVSRVVAYRISDGKLATVAEFDKKYFAVDTTNLMTIDEESSGVINVNSLLRTSGDKNSYFFFNAQVHTTVAKARPDLAPSADIEKAAIEGGQYYLLKISDWSKIFA